MDEYFEDKFGVGEAARLCGLSQKQLRYWEKRGYIPAPRRMNYGGRKYRQFSETDLLLIREIKVCLDEGYSLLPAARKAAVEIKNFEEIH